MLAEKMNNIDIYELDPNFAVVYSFLGTFGEQIGEAYKDISIKEFKEFLEADKVDTSHILVTLHRNFFRAIGTKNCKPEEWEKGVIKFCEDFPNGDGDLIKEKGYANVPVEVKLRVLKNLCEDQFEFNDKFNRRVNAALKNGELDDTIHNDPIGRDKLGRSYWFFMDKEGSMRLFRGWRHTLTGEEKWNRVCRDCDELTELIDELQNAEQLTQDDPILPLKKTKGGEYPVTTIQDLFSDQVHEDVAQALYTSGQYYRVPVPWSPTKVLIEEEKHELPHSYVKISRLKKPRDSNNSDGMDKDNNDSEDKETDDVSREYIPDHDSKLEFKKRRMGPKSKVKQLACSDQTPSIVKVKQEPCTNDLKSETDYGNIKPEFVKEECCGFDDQEENELKNYDKTRQAAEKHDVKIKNSTGKCDSKKVDSNNAVKCRSVSPERIKVERNILHSDISDTEESMPTLRNEQSDSDKSDLDIFETIPVLLDVNKEVEDKVSDADKTEVSVKSETPVDKSSSVQTSQENKVQENCTDTNKSRTCIVELEKLSSDSFKSLGKESIEKSPIKTANKISPNKSPRTKPCVVELENINPLNERLKHTSASPKKCDDQHKKSDISWTSSVEVTSNAGVNDKIKPCVVEVEKLNPDNVHKNGKLPVNDHSKSQNNIKVKDKEILDTKQSGDPNSAESNKILSAYETHRHLESYCAQPKTSPKNENEEKGDVINSSVQLKEPEANKQNEAVGCILGSIDEKGDNQCKKSSSQVDEKLNSTQSINSSFHCEKAIIKNDIQTSISEPDTSDELWGNNPVSNHKTVDSQETHIDTMDDVDMDSDVGSDGRDMGTGSISDSDNEGKEPHSAADLVKTEKQIIQTRVDNTVTSVSGVSSDRRVGNASKPGNNGPLDIDKQNIDNALKDLITLESIIKHGKTVDEESVEDTGTPAGAASVGTDTQEDEGDELFFKYLYNSSYQSPDYRRLVSEYKPKKYTTSSMFEQEQTCKRETLEKVKSKIGRSQNQIKKKGDTGPKKGTPLKKPSDESTLSNLLNMSKKDEDCMEVDSSSSTITASKVGLATVMSSQSSLSTVSVQGTTSTSTSTASTPSVLINTKTPQPALGTLISVLPQPPLSQNNSKSSTNTVPPSVVILPSPLVPTTAVGDKAKTSQPSLLPSNIILPTTSQLVASGLLQLPFQPLLMNSVTANMTSLLTSKQSPTVKSLLSEVPSLKFPRSLLTSNTTLSNLQPKLPVSQLDFLNAHKKIEPADNKMTIKMNEKATVSKEVTIIRKESGELYDKNTGKPFNIPAGCVVAFLKPDGKYYEALSGKVIDMKLDLSKFKQKPAVMCIKKQPPPSAMKPNQASTAVKSVYIDKAKLKADNRLKAQLKEKVQEKAQVQHNMNVLKSQLKAKTQKASQAQVPNPQQSISVLANMLKKPETGKGGQQNTLPKPRKRRKKGRPKMSDEDESEDEFESDGPEEDGKSSGSEAEVDPDYDYDKISRRVKLVQAGWLPKKYKVKLDDSEEETDMDTGRSREPDHGRNARLLAPSQGLYSVKHEAMDTEVSKSPCVTCQQMDNPNDLLICDECDECYHRLCLPTLLTVVPLEDWLCPQCEHNFLIEELKKKRQKVRRILGKKYKSVPVTNREGNLNTLDMFELSQANIIQRKSGRSSKVVNYSEDKFDKLVKQAVKDAETDSSDTEEESKNETEEESESKPQKTQKKKEKKKLSHKSTKSQGTKKGGNSSKKQASEPSRSKKQKLDSDLSDDSDFNCSGSSSSSDDYTEPSKDLKVKSTEPVEEIYYTSSGRKTNSMSRVSKYL